MYSLTETQGFEELFKKHHIPACQNNILLTNFLQLLYISAYDQKKKSPKQQPSEENQVASSPDIKIITRIKLKYLSEKINEYGSNHMFQLLDESPLKDLIELEDMKNLCGNTVVNTT